MAYATIVDLVAAYGEVEIERLSTPQGADLAGVVAARVQPRLDEAGGLMDSYLRRRYAVPIAPVSPELRACCCALARYALSFGGTSEPSEQTRLDHKARLTWLSDIADGRVTLDGAVPAGPNSFAMVQDRPRMVGDVNPFDFVPFRQW